ncbi:PASTA domain-containing protein [Enterococcus sp. JM4C]|uniref:PASTA domain-containing protein n=1 Tax=Candidatus Enterococcus huntleyi TaxID=1857217 RepID=UPI00137B4703|nr:PASTA domain-containing protein [Enterococcus sp. JM4C]KAF1296764.1 PASTA domain-containing protein [Enterococcus sp. JM4C]
MSDFLSNFTSSNYSGEPKNPKKKADDSTEETTPEEPQSGTVQPDEVTKTATSRVEKSAKKEEPKSESAVPFVEPLMVEEDVATNPVQSAAEQQEEAQQTRRRFQEEETETDPDYKKQQIKKYGIIAGIVVVVCAILFTVYYQVTHVKVPDFAKKELSEARTWTSENDVKLKVDQIYDFEAEPNVIIKQSVAKDKKIKKGNELVITASLGPDPEQKIALPEFKDFSVEAARDWIAENKAENVTLIEEYNDKIEDGVFIKSQFSNKDLDPAEYARKDKLQVYYSKGKEVFEKNIEVPDFKGKNKAEVQEWATKNGVKLEAATAFSDTVEMEKVLSQETAKGTKIAKNDTFKIKVSKGQAIVVPDYSQYTVEEASQLQTKITAQIRSVFTPDVPYGRFISQSVEAGKEYNEEDVLPNVKVLYSEGQPYMNDLRGQTVEGDLQKTFYEAFESKGAYVTYEVYYVDSSESKGTVVEMSRFSEFIPIDAHIYIGISKGNLQPVAPPVATGGDMGDDGSAPEAPSDEANNTAEETNK